MEDTKNKASALSAAIAQIEKNFGRGTIMRLGSGNIASGIQFIPTGSIGLDSATGIGGFPRGRVVEIYGPESSGKTTLALNAVAQAQATGGLAAFIDAEHALDIHYAKRIGVNIEDLLISQPDTGEQALEIVEALVRSQALDIIVVDSVAALVPKAEIEGDMGASLPGLQARLMSQAMRKLTSSISKSMTTVIFINQIRMKIGVMFGSPETTTGGNALKFYASMRLDIRRFENIKDGNDIIGGRVRVKVVKNKLAPPFRQAEFDVLFNQGISRTGEVVDIGTTMGIIEKSGAWYSYGGNRLGQGREKVKEYLAENPNVCEAIISQILPNADKIAADVVVSEVEVKSEDEIAEVAEA